MTFVQVPTMKTKISRRSVQEDLNIYCLEDNGFFINEDIVFNITSWTKSLELKVIDKVGGHIINFLLYPS